MLIIIRLRARITTVNQAGAGLIYSSNSNPVTFGRRDRKSTRLNSSHGYISYAVFCLKKKKPRHQYPSAKFAPVSRPFYALLAIVIAQARDVHFGALPDKVSTALHSHEYTSAVSSFPI